MCFDANQVAAELETPLMYFAICPARIGEFMSSTSIRVYIEQRTGLKLSQQKLSICLKEIGYAYDTIRIEGKLQRGFWVHEKLPSQSLQPIQATQENLPF